MEWYFRGEMENGVKWVEMILIFSIAKQPEEKYWLTN